MKKILAIGGSNSKNSINTLFAAYVANEIEDARVITLNWNDIVLPLYSPDLEAESGIPKEVDYFKELVQSVDAIILSLAEYNGMPTAAFKNLWDWTSRIDMQFWSNKPIFLAAVSPGRRGGANVLAIVSKLMPHFAGKIITQFSLPSFALNFQNGALINEELKKELTAKIFQFQQAI